MKGFSKGERILYREIVELKKGSTVLLDTFGQGLSSRFQRKFGGGVPLPVPTKKIENKNMLGTNTESALVEWEKNQIKPLFRALDSDKKGLKKE